MTDENVDEVSPLLFANVRGSYRSIDRRTRSERKISMWLILLSAGFERLAFYSLAGNLVLFLTSNNIHWTPVHSVTASFIFLGVSYISALFFAWISDGKIGRAKTITLGFILYLIGYVLITLFSDYEDLQTYRYLCGTRPINQSIRLNFTEEKCFGPILSTLILTALGVGAVQANMAVFGAEQVRDEKATSLFFDRYYAIINAGGLVAFGGIAYAQQNNSYFIGYVVPAAVLAVALVLFVAGYRVYIHVQSDESIMSRFVPVWINAIRNWRKQRRNRQSLGNRRVSSSLRPLIEAEPDSSDNPSSNSSTQTQSFLDYAKLSNQGKFIDRVVDDIKSLRPIIAVFLLLTPYWLMYFQIETTFLIQGVHMKVPKFFHKEQGTSHYMPVIWLSLADQIIIIVTIFILNTFVYKRLARAGRRFSIRSRIIVGMLSATLAMSIAGAVEIFREKGCSHSSMQTIGRTNYNASDMSIFYQLPQYIGIGLSEVFTSVASLEFAYLAAPRSAQSLIMSLRFCSAGLSSFIGSLYVGVFVLVKKDFTFENNKCAAAEEKSFHIYFFGLAAIQLIFVLIFLICDRRYQILKLSKRRFNTRLFITSDSQVPSS